MKREAIAEHVFMIPQWGEEDFSWGSNYTQVAVIVDENTVEHCYPKINPFLPENHHLIKIQSGEENKNLATCTKIWEGLTAESFDRKALVLNLGGGVIGDMGGFCAAAYKRGIDFVQIPTTLLAQVDASVGGKLGIDFQGFKNHIGFFEQPNAVLIHPDFLSTLPVRELRSGFAEVIKHALIADAAQWTFLLKQEDFRILPWEEIIPHSIKIKAKVVAQDPREAGLRKILNFGHTVGHAVESYLLLDSDRKLLHGEAIGLGMVAEAYLSHELCSLPQSSLAQIAQYVISVYGNVELSEQDIGSILPITLQDKKNKGKTVQMALLEETGRAVFDIPVPEKLIREALEYYLSLRLG